MSISRPFITPYCVKKSGTFRKVIGTYRWISPKAKMLYVQDLEDPAIKNTEPAYVQRIYTNLTDNCYVTYPNGFTSAIQYAQGNDTAKGIYVVDFYKYKRDTTFNPESVEQELFKHYDDTTIAMYPDDISIRHAIRDEIAKGRANFTVVIKTFIDEETLRLHGSVYSPDSGVILSVGNLKAVKGPHPVEYIKEAMDKAYDNYIGITIEDHLCRDFSLQIGTQTIPIKSRYVPNANGEKCKISIVRRGYVDEETIRERKYLDIHTPEEKARYDIAQEKLLEKVTREFKEDIVNHYTNEDKLEALLRALYEKEVKEIEQDEERGKKEPDDLVSLLRWFVDLVKK